MTAASVNALFVIGKLFPWPILAAMIAYVSIGVGVATFRTSREQIYNGLCFSDLSFLSERWLRQQ